MSLGAIERTVMWRRRGLDEPWLPDSFMAELSPESVRQLERHGRVRHDVESIVLTGDEASVLIVLDGAVKVFRSYWDGRQALVYIAGFGDVLNAEALLTDKDVPNASLAAGRAAVLTVPRRRFGRLVTQHEDIRHSAGTFLDLGLTQPEIASALGVPWPRSRTPCGSCARQAGFRRNALRSFCAKYPPRRSLTRPSRACSPPGPVPRSVSRRTSTRRRRGLPLPG